jgi:arsenite-transporting ATPase
MRVILITGKGGVGKTTVAAATAITAADRGHRTLVMSTDPAHSLGDAFDMPLGDSPSKVVDGLDAQQIDSQMRLEESWGAVRDHLTELFDWSGLHGIEAEELTVFPGMDELFSLASIREHAGSDNYDRSESMPDQTTTTSSWSIAPRQQRHFDFSASPR